MPASTPKAASAAASSSGTGVGAARTRTKYVTTACVTCKQKKIKCDGLKPRCSSCVLALRDCVYRPDGDRRKHSRKNNVQSLVRYCQQLEGLLRENGIPLPPLPDHLQPGEGGDKLDDEERSMAMSSVGLGWTPRPSKDEFSPAVLRRASNDVGTSTNNPV